MIPERHPEEVLSPLADSAVPLRIRCLLKGSHKLSPHGDTAGEVRRDRHLPGFFPSSHPAPATGA